MRYLLLVLLFLCGCQSTNVDEGKQKLRLNLYSEPPTLDPRKATDSTSVNVIVALFEGLTRLGFDDKPQPALAKSIDISKDGKTYTFHLRDTVWNDGTPLTANDFLETWQNILTPNYPAPYAYKLFMIKNAILVKMGKKKMSALGIKAPDKNTLVVTLEHPTPYFLELTAFPPFTPVNAIAFKNDDWAANCGPDFISNGPFLLKSWSHDSEIVLEKNPRYWDVDSVALDEINMAMIDDSTTEFNMYEQCELDWCGSPLSNLPTDILPILKKEGRLHTYPISGGYYYKINTTKFPCNNENVRKALSYAINRQSIVEHVLQGNERPALSMVPPLANEKNPVNFFPDNAEKLAKEKLALGLKELNIEKLPSLVISYNTNREHQKIAQAIQQQWKEVLGIEATLEHSDWKVYISKVSSMDFEIARMGWLEDYNDPLSFLEPFKYCDDDTFGSNNNTGWCDPAYTALLDDAENELNTRKRREYLFRAEELLMEAMPVIPIYFLAFKYLKKPYVKDVYLSEMGTVDYKWAKILNSK